MTSFACGAADDATRRDGGEESSGARECERPCKEVRSGETACGFATVCGFATALDSAAARSS
ncbi:MAG: hypothetical protein QOJ70_3126, partial [Acidobacteriota bacterium]|nr:hypothetical protein [Acidobacteriota bacterium]